MQSEAGAAIRRTGLALLGLAFLALAFDAAQAAPVLPTWSWDAASPGGSPASAWAPEGAGGTWTVSGASHVTGTSGLSVIGAAYAFDGVSDRIFGPSLETQGALTGLRTSFELWFRPSDLAGGPQVLFETGGRIDGLSITLNDADLLFRVQDDSVNVVSLGHDLGPIGVSEFIQVVGVVDLGATALLFVNGSQVASGSAAGILDWSGSGAAGVGDVNGRVGGTNGPGEGDLFGYGNFAGEIAILRYYENASLDATQVADAYAAVASAPEPGTALLLGVGLAAFTVRRWPRTTAGFAG